MGAAVYPASLFLLCFSSGRETLDTVVELFPKCVRKWLRLTCGSWWPLTCIIQISPKGQLIDPGSLTESLQGSPIWIPHSVQVVVILSSGSSQPMTEQGRCSELGNSYLMQGSFEYFALELLISLVGLSLSCSATWVSYPVLFLSLTAFRVSGQQCRWKPLHAFFCFAPSTLICPSETFPWRLTSLACLIKPWHFLCRDLKSYTGFKA